MVLCELRYKLLTSRFLRKDLQPLTGGTSQVMANVPKATCSLTRTPRELTVTHSFCRPGPAQMDRIFCGQKEINKYTDALNHTFSLCHRVCTSWSAALIPLNWVPAWAEPLPLTHTPAFTTLQFCFPTNQCDVVWKNNISHLNLYLRVVVVLYLIILMTTYLTVHSSYCVTLSCAD